MDGWEKIHSFTFCDLKETFIFMSKFSIEACRQMKFELKEGRTHLFIYCPKKTQSLTEN